MSLMAHALCLAIIRASATVRAPSSMRKPLSCPGFAPCSAASPAARAVCGVKRLADEACSASRARQGRVARPPRAMRAVAHGVALHLQRHSRRGEREGIGFAVADLVIGRGAAQRRRRHANAQDQLVRAGAWSRCRASHPARGGAPPRRWCAGHPGPSTSTWHRRRQERSASRRDKRRCRHRCRPSSAWPRSMPAMGRATAAGLALVAGERLAAAEVGAARALQQIAAKGRHVAELLRGGPPQRLRERRIVLQRGGGSAATSLIRASAPKTSFVRPTVSNALSSSRPVTSTTLAWASRY